MSEVNKINAQPTKDLFVTMLIRDLVLKDAIGDLVDNSVDGAKQVVDVNIHQQQKMSNDKPYKDLYVNITANENEFIIEDNCGGISIDIAKNYAFRFGRPSSVKNTEYSVGMFGIGMKRALFKLGSFFTVESFTKTSSFTLEVDVETWRVNDDWSFEFKSQEAEIVNKIVGTKITVTKLRDDVVQQFNDEKFQKRLAADIELEHLYNIHRGLTIKINDIKLKSRKLELLTSDDFKVAHYKKTYLKDVDVEIYAGISQEDSLDNGGWYVFCNDRLIVGPEQSSLTGWTGKNGGGAPKYHGQYQRFRGFVFFSSKKPEKLPWNTTKTGMDSDAPLYKSVRLKMIELMRPIISFLNDMKDAKKEDADIWQRITEDTTPTLIAEIQQEQRSTAFVHPNIEIQESDSPVRTRISYLEDKEKVDIVKKYFKVNNNQKVGEKTFKYFYEMEIE